MLLDARYLSKSTNTVATPLSACGEGIFTLTQLYPKHGKRADREKANGTLKTGERKEESNFYTGDEVKTNKVMRQVRSKKTQLRR